MAAGVDSPEYHVWEMMIECTTNSKTSNYRNYGGHGITVCARWRYAERGKSGFERFRARPGNTLLSRKGDDARIRSKVMPSIEHQLPRRSG